MNGKTVHFFEESALSRDQVIEKFTDNLYQVRASLPFTSQLVWWLRGFGKKLLQIEPESVANAVYETAVES